MTGEPDFPNKFVLHVTWKNDLFSRISPRRMTEALCLWDVCLSIRLSVQTLHILFIPRFKENPSMGFVHTWPSNATQGVNALIRFRTKSDLSQRSLNHG